MGLARRSCRRHSLVLWAATLRAVSGCAEGETAAPTGRRDAGAAAAPSGTAGIVFRSQELPFRYDRGETGAAWPVEVTGGGVGLLDFDGDGDLDLFFAQGGPLRPVGSSGTADALLRNE